MKKICMIGQGGHSKVIKDIILSLNEYEITAYLDDRFIDIEQKNGAVYGPVSLADNLASDDSMSFVIAIGNNKIRKKIMERLELPSFCYATLIHPSAIISSSASIGFGTVIMPGAVVNADTRIGDHAIINTRAVIEHDNMIGDFAHISPNATLTGTVQIGEGTHIGAGATVIPNTYIGSWSIVGAGATVIRNIEGFQTVVGTPAKLIK